MFQESGEGLFCPQSGFVFSRASRFHFRGVNIAQSDACGHSLTDPDPDPGLDSITINHPDQFGPVKAGQCDRFSLSFRAGECEKKGNAQKIEW